MNGIMFSLLTTCFIALNSWEASSQTNPVEGTQAWDFYFRTVEGQMLSTYLDMGLYDSSPIETRTNLGIVLVEMNFPSQYGMSTTRESETLFDIEDSINHYVSQHCNSIYVGRTTYNGCRAFFFYLEKEIGWKETIQKVMDKFPTYTFHDSIEPDPEWEFYREVLYPSPEVIQTISNRHVIEQLQAHGDPLTHPRDVFHWVYFKSDSTRNSFAEAVKEKGFIVVNQTWHRSSEDYPYGLYIKRYDSVDWESVNRYVLYLWTLASEYQGEYDGWETSVQIE